MKSSILARVLLFSKNITKSRNIPIFVWEEKNKTKNKNNKTLWSKKNIIFYLSGLYVMSTYFLYSIYLTQLAYDMNKINIKHYMGLWYDYIQIKWRWNITLSEELLFFIYLRFNKPVDYHKDQLLDPCYYKSLKQLFNVHVKHTIFPVQISCLDNTF